MYEFQRVNYAKILPLQVKEFDAYNLNFLV